MPLLARRTAKAADPPIIGLLRSASGEGAADLLSAFRRGLAEIGYLDGRDVIVEYRSADGQSDHLAKIVGELLRRPVAAIAGNSVVALTAKAMTTTVPIVFASGYDPVREGLVASINRPGGNITGVTFLNNTLSAKQLELLRELEPAATIGLLADKSVPAGMLALADAQAAAATLGIRVVAAAADTAEAIDMAFAGFAKQQVRAVAVLGSAFFFSRRDQIVALAARYAVATIYENRVFVASGGLMSYGGDIVEAYRQVGNYTGQILKGAKPGDLPVIRSSKVELAINLRTARALGLTMPPIVLARADEVID